jgi:hypothetical protein
MAISVCFCSGLVELVTGIRLACVLARFPA